MVAVLEKALTFPPLPAWNALHVLVVHIPIGLLLVAVPVLIALAFLFPKTGRQFVWAAAVILLIGTASCWLAVQTGAAAGDLAEAQGAKSDNAIYQALQLHEKLADETRLIYTALTAVFLLFLFAPIIFRRQLNPAFNAVCLLIFLIASAAAGVQLANTGHAGGLLVHEHGITAQLVNSDAAAAATQDATQHTQPDSGTQHKSDAED